MLRSMKATVMTRTDWARVCDDLMMLSNSSMATANSKGCIQPDAHVFSL